MQRLRILSAVEQVAEYLKDGIGKGVWRGEMPGAAALAADLGVNHKTAEAALARLVRDGILTDQGLRKSRLISKTADHVTTPSLRIAILLHDSADRRKDYMVEISHLLQESGHAPFFTRKSLSDFAMDAERVAAFVNSTQADAWIVVSAPRGVLEWFAAGSRPVFGLFGFMRRLPIAGAGPDKSASYAEVARRLVVQGHQSIVLLARPQRRHPLPGLPERMFLHTLSESGIKVSDYHFPYWENSKDGVHRCLVSLFRNTPPTALVVQEAELFGAVQQFLGERGIRVPHDVSLVCDDPDPTFAWRIPSVAHIRWNEGPCVRRVVRWANQIACGKDDRRKLLTPAEFVDGGTLARNPLRKPKVRKPES